MLEILVATHNKNKRREISALLSGYRKKTKVKNLDDLNTQPPMIVENGKTFRQNAVKKAVTVSKYFNGLVVADDSGLEVNALGGKPGVRSARFARAKATDLENNQKLLKLLEKMPKKDRKARFVCNIALAAGGILLETFEGTIDGRIVSSPRGENGFGYDPLFVPEDHDKTFAEMAPAYKNKISHRGRALRKMKRVLKKYVEAN
ncbi:MAG: XTP/dITP diphosphatase [Candidatus Omnitrophica bacterium]|nr:XTP/dITP diphosphatase [Candidatus Omnitrophota bacterium]